MSESIDALQRLSEWAIAHDEALVRGLRAEIARLKEADRLLELTWMWPENRVDLDKLEQDVWDHFDKRRSDQTTEKP